MDLATAYDAINAAIFLPSGGSHRLRKRLVDAMEVRPGHRVLELGCGTGQVTASLVAAGASVVAVDALPAMLEAARRRAPGATFVQGDVIEAQVLVAAMTNANVGIPARDNVITTSIVETPQARPENHFSQRGQSDNAAASNAGVTMHRYIERLFS